MTSRLLKNEKKVLHVRHRFITIQAMAEPRLSIDTRESTIAALLETSFGRLTGFARKRTAFSIVLRRRVVREALFREFVKLAKFYTYIKNGTESGIIRRFLAGTYSKEKTDSKKR